MPPAGATAGRSGRPGSPWQASSRTLKERTILPRAGQDGPGQDGPAGGRSRPAGRPDRAPPPGEPAGDAAPHPPAAGRAPWRQRAWRPFRRLLEAQVASAAGDVMVAVALADTLFFSVPLGEARAQVFGYLMLTMAPFAVLSPLVGPWLDRRPGSYRAAIVGAMVGRVVLVILLSNRVDQVLLYPLAFGLLVLSRVHAVSRAAIVPEARPPGRTLMWVNGRLAVASTVGGAAGVLPALALSRWLGAGATLWAAAVAFGAGALAATGVPAGEGRPPPPRERRRLQPPLTSRLVAGGVAMATLRTAVGFTTFLLAFLVRAEGAGSAGLGLVAAAAGAGGFLGAAAGPRLRAFLPEPAVLVAVLGATAVAAFWGAGGFGLGAAALVAAVTGFAASAGRLAFDSLLQHDAPERVRARTIARYETTFQLGWVAGGGLAAAVPFSPGSGLGALTALCLAGLAAAVRGLRRQRPGRPRAGG